MCVGFSRDFEDLRILVCTGGIKASPWIPIDSGPVKDGSVYLEAWEEVDYGIRRKTGHEYP